MKRKVHYRHKWSWIDLKMDGIMPKERLKGKFKKDYQRITRNSIKKETQKEIKQFNKERYNET